METCIRKYAAVDIKDISEVGYKNASIGKTMRHLSPAGVLIPQGFAVTADAYRQFIQENKLEHPLRYLLAALDKEHYSNLGNLAGGARKLIMDGHMPADLGMEIIDAYDYLFDMTEPEVAVRSSAVSDHLADAAAIGLNESILNVKGHHALLYAVKQCFASLFTERAVRHAAEKGYDPCKTVMAVAVQQMVRSDIGCSGVGYTSDPDSKNQDNLCLKAMLGLGELINQSAVESDEYRIFKPSIKTGSLLIERNRGNQQKRLVYADEEDETNQTVLKDMPTAIADNFILNVKDIQRLAEWAVLLDDLYQHPVCFEWAKDGLNHQLYLIQAGPMMIPKGVTY